MKHQIYVYVSSCVTFDLSCLYNNMTKSDVIFNCLYLKLQYVGFSDISWCSYILQPTEQPSSHPALQLLLKLQKAL